MSFSLKLELKNSNKVLVTNSATNEFREVSLAFIQDVTRDSLSMLIQYKYYEVIINAETVWSRVKQLDVAQQSTRKVSQTSSLILKLRLKGDTEVIVTNSQTEESRTVTMRYIQEASGNSLLMLIQYEYYELIINTDKIWQKVKRFNCQAEKIKEIEIEQKFRDIMVNDQWIKITEHDREMYNKALATLAMTSNFKSYQKKFDRFMFVPMAGGALAGALTYNTVGGMGIAAAGTAFEVGALGLTALGVMSGLAVYGVGKAID